MQTPRHPKMLLKLHSPLANVENVALPPATEGGKSCTGPKILKSQDSQIPKS
jgi:hypothetical protein